jgi:hypothetical protein
MSSSPGPVEGWGISESTKGRLNSLKTIAFMVPPPKKSFKAAAQTGPGEESLHGSGKGSIWQREERDQENFLTCHLKLYNRLLYSRSYPMKRGRVKPSSAWILRILPKEILRAVSEKSAVSRWEEEFRRIFNGKNE